MSQQRIDALSVDQLCLARAWTHQGVDTTRCDLPIYHEGKHMTVGLFSFEWGNVEAQEVFRWRMQKT